MFLGIINSLTKRALLHKLIALSIFQTAIILLFLTIGFHSNSQPPLIDFNQEARRDYANPLPHALMLTAIVVGIATFAVGLTINIKINILQKRKLSENPDKT